MAAGWGGGWTDVRAERTAPISYAGEGGRGRLAGRPSLAPARVGVAHRKRPERRWMLDVPRCVYVTRRARPQGRPPSRSPVIVSARSSTCCRPARSST